MDERRARQNLLDIWAWRGRDHPERGDAVLDRIEAACSRLQRLPHLGPPFARIGTDARKLTIDGYLALYRIGADAVLIVRVIEQRRLPEAVAFDDQ